MGGVRARRWDVKGQRRGVKVWTHALKGGGKAVKGYGTELHVDQEAWNNNGGVVTVDGEALKGDAWRSRGEERRSVTKGQQRSVKCRRRDTKGDGKVVKVGGDAYKND